MSKEPRAFRVSPEDHDLLEGGWNVDSRGYVLRTRPNLDGGRCPSGRKRQRKVLLHRLIAVRLLGRELVKGEVVDHINFNTSDNLRENLRVCTYSMNGAHRRVLATNNTSGYRGVSWEKDCNKFRASIKVMGKTRSLGFFPTEEAAAARYLEVATKEFGEFLGAVK